MANGGCHCGAVRYSIDGELKHSAVCHCETCRRTTGALTTAWAAYPGEGLRVEGRTQVYNSSDGVERHFCGKCGTSLFYFNERAMPGVADVLIATLDRPQDCPPQVHVNMADALKWEAGVDVLPKFERYPGAG
jgi:hypothetical protein